MKKISMLITNLAGGGAERVNLDLAYEFKKLGYEVEFVLCNATGTFLTEAKENFNVVDLCLSSLFKLPQKLAAYIDSSKPDAVIASMWGLTAFTPFAKLISKHNPIILLVEHNSLINQFKHSKFLTRVFLRISTFISYRLADRLAGVSLGVTKDMIKLACLKTGKNIEVLYNPIPSKLTASVDLHKPEFWDDCTNKVLNVGSFKEQKNQKLLIQAFNLVQNKIDVKLIILGQGVLDGQLKALVKQLGLQEKVYFHGFTANPNVFFQCADLFVLSSDREGFGNVIVESLSCGTPVVSTDCEHGPAEILNNGEFGMLVPVGDEVALAEAMLQSLNKDHDTEKLINHAKDFAPEISAKRYLKLLDL